MTALLKYYFSLRLTLLQRRVKDFGIDPRVALLGVIGITAIFAFKLSESSEHQGKIVTALAVYLLAQNTHPEQQRFTEKEFGKPISKVIGLIENFLLVLPALFILMVLQEWLYAMLVIGIAGFLALIQLNFSGLKTLPTPFGNHPFEFTVGFRRGFGGYLIAIVAMVVGIIEANANLSIFGLLAIAILHIGFYQAIEAPQWVIVFNQTPKAFLHQKIKTGLLLNTLTILPFAAVLSIVFPETWYLALAALAISNVYLAQAICLKYTSFPNEVQITQAVMFGASILIPTMLLLTFPVFYKLALRSLKRYL